MNLGHAVVGLASCLQLDLWTGCERGLAMDRAGKRHQFPHVGFEEMDGNSAKSSLQERKDDDLIHEYSARHSMPSPHYTPLHVLARH